MQALCHCRQMLTCRDVRRIVLSSCGHVHAEQMAHMNHGRYSVLWLGPSGGVQHGLLCQMYALLFWHLDCTETPV